MFSVEELRAAAEVVYTQMQPTPQYAWPQLAALTGVDVWVKHENHTPTGSFKLRGAITFIDWVTRSYPEARGICTATRGNHGQGQARSAAAAGLTAKVFVPYGNSVEKNAAMRAFGAEVIEFGADFDAAKAEASRVSEAEGLVTVPPFHPELVRGVASYPMELLTALPDLDTIYVPIGCGSGICSCITARDALGLQTEIVGVVSAHAQTAKLSAEAGRLVPTKTARTFADGMAVREPVQEALDIYAAGAARFVVVSEEEVAAAVRTYYRETHNLAEGAGAAPLAGLLQERDRMQGKKVAVILCGGNIDTDWFLTVMKGGVPQL